MKTLTFEERCNIINRFEQLKDEDFCNKVLNSEIVYKNILNMGLDDSEVIIYLSDDYLYINRTNGSSYDLQPLIIEVSEDGTIMDFMLLDFTIRFHKILNLDRYFVSSSDYLDILDEV